MSGAYFSDRCSAMIDTRGLIAGGPDLTPCRLKAGHDGPHAAAQVGEQSYSRSWDDATPMELLQAEVQSLREGLPHLKECVEGALRLCAAIPGAPVRPEDVLDEEWSK